MLLSLLRAKAGPQWAKGIVVQVGPERCFVKTVDGRVLLASPSTRGLSPGDHVAVLARGGTVLAVPVSSPRPARHVTLP